MLLPENDKISFPVILQNSRSFLDERLDCGWRSEGKLYSKMQNNSSGNFNQQFETMLPDEHNLNK